MPTPPGMVALEGTKEPLPRTELAALPLVAGSSDIGVQLGGIAALTRLVEGYKPYRWKADVLLSLSIKDGPRGLEVAQQSHDVRLDVPRFLDSRVRLMTGIFVERHVNAGYFGLGNAAPAIANPDGRYGNKYQAITTEGRLRVNARVPIHGAFDLMVGLQVRYTDATAYPGSQLERDAAARYSNGDRVILGMDPVGTAIPAIGFVYDTRDEEISPHRGAFDMIGVRASYGLPTTAGVRYVGFSGMFRRYTPLFGPFVLAGRIFGDAMIGDVPFYDLSQGGTFIAHDLIGGPEGVRGVPNGRYAGKMKIVGNIELRAFLLSFRLLGERFRMGTQVFFDTGRVWNDWKNDPARDGRTLGLKYGVGGGLYFIWGEAAVFRLELAYSPDARSANPNFPIGLYADDGHMF